MTGAMAYKLALPKEMSDVHNVFHVSHLKKCLRIPEELLPLETTEDLQYEERTHLNLGYGNSSNQKDNS